MIPRGLVGDARTGNGTYDYHALFAPFKELFSSVDLMCVNLEAPLAGKGRGYSGWVKGKLLFNAPDAVLDPLKNYGVDMVTTGNNHCPEGNAV